MGVLGLLPVLYLLRTWLKAIGLALQLFGVLSEFRLS